MPTAKLGSYTIQYRHSEEYHRLKREIWGDHCYYTELANEHPVIIDAGAHIGMSTLYFAKQFPTAKIIAIEPNPITRELLETNIWDNRLEDRVEVVAAALSDHSGHAQLHHLTAEEWQLNANLTATAWNDAPLTHSTQVETITLSSLLNQPVDLLKLDIESAELAVLGEARQYLSHVGELFVEFHPARGNSLEVLCRLLTDQGFSPTVWQKNKLVQDSSRVSGLCMVQAKRKYSY